MPIQFPSNPTVGQVYINNGRSWTYDGRGWAPGATGINAANIAVYDEGSLVTGTVTGLNFVGAGITANTVSGNVQITVTATGTGSGDGPKITNVEVTNSSWTVLDDTAVDTAGGYVKITGNNFVSGCQVAAGTTTASAVSFVSSTELRVQFGAIAAGTYILYVSNPDGGVALRVNGITFSASPSWQTGSSLGEIYDGVVINLGLVATEATSYAVTAGSLPPGLSLNANTGVITGTVTGVTVDTTYNFTVTATDPQNQDSPRAFSITVSVSDPYFKLTSLLLSGSAISANTVVRDSSTNNFNLTVYGDARASNFTPYGTGWSAYFDGDGDFLYINDNSAWAFGSGDFTIEGWVYRASTGADHSIIVQTDNVSTTLTSGVYWLVNASNKLQYTFASTVSTYVSATSTSNILSNTWYHIAVVRNGNTITQYINGVADGTANVTGLTMYDSPFTLAIGRLGERPIWYWSGHISNIRVVKGTAVYTANFVPPTAPLTAIANTSLLTCHTNRFLDSSTNNFAITRNGDAKVTSFNPFNLTNTGTTGSVYFDGSGDYLSIPYNSNLWFSSSNWTIEVWYYPTSFSTNNVLWEFGYGSPNTIRSLIIYSSLTTGAIRIAQSPDGTTNYDVATGGTLTLNTWSHLAFVRNGANITTYINGVSQGTITAYSLYNSTTRSFYIGVQGDLQAGTLLNGYLSDYRVNKGTAVYTTNFTPPTSPLTAVANTQLLTLQYDQPHNNHTFLDSSSNQFVVTRSGNATQGTFSPFSQTGWGNYFDGTGDYFTVPYSANFNLSSGDWTMEAWFNANSFASSMIIIGKDTSGVNYDWSVLIGSSTSIALYTQRTAVNLTVTVPAMSVGVWYHVAYVRNGSTNTIYLNGVAYGSNTMTISNESLTTPTIGCGSYNNPGSFMNGYISNLRVVKGTAVYTSNFTPPTAPLTAISGTSLLTCQSNRFLDASTNNLTITKNGDTRVVAFSPFAATAVYNPAVHGGSAYVNATSTYLALPASTPLVNISDWTVDFWMYPTSYVNAQGIFGASNGGGASLKISFQINGSNITLYKTGAAIISISQPPLNQWTHLSVVRSSSTGLAYIFVNGVLGTSGSFGSEAVTSNFQLFTNGEGATSGMYGYLSSFRVSNIARQITAFTVPTQPYQADTNTILLTNFTDSAILDSTGRTVLETVADAKSSSVITKFTGGSMYFDGTGDWIITSQPPSFYNLPGNFTIEFWIYIVSAGGSLDIMGTSNNIAYIGAGQSGWVIAWSTSTGLRFGWQTNNTWSVDGQINSTNRIVNAWAHIAVVRNGSTITGYVNGSSTGSTLTSSTNLTSTLYSLYIGAGAGNQGGILTGYLSDIRITQGYARYTANFTAPTAPARLK